MHVSSNTYQGIEVPSQSRRVVYWRSLLVFLYAGTIFALSSVPGARLPSIGVSDKLLHAMEFGGLTLLLCRALRAYAPTRSQRFIALVSVVAAVGYGTIDEGHQLLVQQRIADMADLAADSVGALLVAWAWAQAERRWPWLR
jgi:VanZ family protein